MRDLLIDKILNTAKYKIDDRSILESMDDETLAALLVGEITPAKAKNSVSKKVPTSSGIAKSTPRKSNDNIISINEVTKSFREKRGKNKVHKGITLDIARGETVALVGANGAGKTVLMETLVRIIKQDKGYIKYDFEGMDPFEEIGMQFQDADSTGRLTPKEMVTFIKKMYRDKVDDKQLKEMIEIYGIKDYYTKKIKKLSGGQRQRVNLLLATMHNPKLMILDEFITGLDILSVRDILEYIKKLKQMNNSTLIIISHQPDEIKSLSDRIFALKDGVIAGEWMTKDINNQYKGDFSKFLLETI